MAQPVSAATADSDGNFRKLWLPAFVCSVLLVLELIGLFHGLEGEVGRTAAPIGPPLAIVRASRNDVRQKSAGTLVWAGSPEGHVFYAQDSVVTLADSEVVVVFNDQSEVVIEAESMVVFEDAPVPVGFSGAEQESKPVIRARVVRGSLLRRKSGTAPLEIRMGEIPAAGIPDTAPIVFRGAHADAVYRVVRRAHGVEVIVQSGAITVQAGSAWPQLLGAGKSGVLDDGGNGELRISDDGGPGKRLPPPRLKKPSIEIVPQARIGSAFMSRLAAFFVRAAHATEGGTQVTVHFAWEAMADAGSYRIQLSKDSAFRELALEQNSSEPAYDFRTRAPSRTEIYYFRVAAIDHAGRVGEFSGAERIEIHPVSFDEIVQESALAPAVPPVVSRPVPEVPKVPTPKAPGSAPVVVASPESPPMPWSWASRVSVHSVWQTRELSSDTLPVRGSGSGWIPLRFQIEASATRLARESWTAGLSFLPSVAKPSTPLVLGTPALPIWQAWAVAGIPSGFGWISAGPYFTTSSFLSWEDLELLAASKFSGGLRFELRPEKFSWRVWLSGLAIGRKGIESGVSFSRSLPVSGLESCFIEAGISARALSGDRYFGGELGVGYEF